MRTNYNKIRLVFYLYIKIIIVLYNVLMFNLKVYFYIDHFTLGIIKKTLN